ncbi:MAG: hypothetical protein ABIF28_08820 [Pseudomonadota bacterium]
MRKTFLITVLAVAAAATPQFVSAHGEAKPRHGGVVQNVNDLGFELVADAAGATIHVDDHGSALASSGMSGKLTVLDGKTKSEAVLKPAGGNRLFAEGARLAPGAKAVATITDAAGKTMTVRFSIRQ